MNADEGDPAVVSARGQANATGIENVIGIEIGIANVKEITWNVREKGSATGIDPAVMNATTAKCGTRATTTNVTLPTTIPGENTAVVDLTVKRSVKEMAAVAAA